MTQPFYDFVVLEEEQRFEFISIGERVIKKSVIYFQTDIPYLYSLTLADVFDDGSLDVYTISDNGDMEKILATVFQTIVVFLTHHPKAIVGFTGSTPSRTRLYQIAIARELDIALERFEIWGIQPESQTFEPFQKNIRYNSFLISNKTSIFE